jgi:hypothetical protein
MTWVQDKQCKWPGCTVLISGHDVEYCPVHEAKVKASHEAMREVALAAGYITRKRRQRKGDGIRPGTPVQQQAMAKAESKTAK